MVFFPLTDLSTNVKAPFGELMTAEPVPAFFMRFDYPFVQAATTISATTGTGQVVQSASRMQVYSNTANSAGNAFIKSKRSVPYCPGQGLDMRFTARWLTSGASTDVQAWSGFGESNNNQDMTDGYFIGVHQVYLGSNVMGIYRADNGSVSAVTQSSFNIDKLDGTGPSGMTIVWGYFNVFKITMQYLGAGNVTFHIINPATGTWQPFHTFRSANALQSAHCKTPTFRFVSSVVRPAATGTYYNIEHVSVGCYTVGARPQGLGVLVSALGSRTITTESPVLAVRNVTTFNGITNRAQSVLKLLSVATDGTKSVTVVMHVNPTLTGGAWSFFDTNNSITEFNSTATLTVAGKKIFQTVVAKVFSQVVDLSMLNIILYPGDVIALTATSASSSDVVFSLTIEEIL